MKEIFIKDLKPKEVSKNSIIWLKTIVEPLIQNALSVIVEDKKGEVIQLAIYNQVPVETKYWDLKKQFPVGMMIGIKQPYLRLNLAGELNIRNDNPENVILKLTGSKALELKNRANEFFLQKKIVDAIKIYLQALDSEGCEGKLKLSILSNLS